MKNLVIRLLSLGLALPAILFFSLVPDAVVAPRKKTRGRWVVEVRTSGVWGANPVLYRGASNASHLLAWVKAEVYSDMLLAAMPYSYRGTMVSTVRSATPEEEALGVNRVWSPYLPHHPKFAGELPGLS
jgi:hypothetical protein